jgi:uncharacterized repeat protein (TIGR03803 family)
MKTSGQREHWISRERSRSLIAALALAVLLSTAVVATPSSHAQTFTVLYSFQEPDGFPTGQLIFDKLGNLYGTGGVTVFELDTSGKETVLHSFGRTGDGVRPTGIVRYEGNIYGATQYGGGTECAESAGCGTVFELSRGKETILHSFTPLDGKFPLGGLTTDGSGNLYGTTFNGSSGGTQLPSCQLVLEGCGTVFEVSNGQERVLHSFGGRPDGEEPAGNLILDRLGNLYGTTSRGGFGWGTVFELSPNSDGTWKETLLHSFTGNRDGAEPNNGSEPEGGVVLDAKGSLYGTTSQGGLNGCGVVFKLEKNSDGSWARRILYNFRGSPDDGQYPSGLVRDKKGNLYGVTRVGGTSNQGTVFQLDGTGQETILHTFTGGPADGEYPFAGLTMDAAGSLYGTTTQGGSGACVGGCGTVFKITP